MNKNYFLKKWPRVYFIKKVNYNVKHFFVTFFTVVFFFKKKNYPVNIYLHFSYKLDYFQKISIKIVLKNQNIFIAAHTSSGKTTVADYAIINCLSFDKKIIYTSPLKAISNQKFRNLFSLFSMKIGLITGDISVNFSANCVIMTTEVLRLLFYQNQLDNRLEWVVLDEIHCIRDKKRGFIWEEILILMPNYIKIICLSATVPNVREFSEWIVDLKNKPMHMIETCARIIAIRQYISFYFDLKLYLVKNKQCAFNLKKHKKPFDIVDLSNENHQKPIVWKKVKKIIQKIYKIGYWPIIIFIFRKKKCFFFLYTLKKKTFCNLFEKNIIHLFFEKCSIVLNSNAKKIFRLRYIFYFFKKGLGIHHSNMLPLIREITEILFQVSLLKILCATETFSIGLNMPVKTVLFPDLRKFDGEILRTLNKGEFIQMSGRAGRRGLDDSGIVISLIKESHKQLKFFKQTTEPVVSKFQDSINTIIKNIHFKNGVNCVQITKSFLKYQIHLSGIKRKKSSIQVLKRKKQLEPPFCFLFSYLLDVINLKKSVERYTDYTFGFKKILYNIFYKMYTFLIYSCAYVLKISKKLSAHCFFLLSTKCKRKSEIRVHFDVVSLVKFSLNSNLKYDIINTRGGFSAFIVDFSFFFLKLLNSIDKLFFLKKLVKKNFKLLTKKLKFFSQHNYKKKVSLLENKTIIQKNLKKTILTLISLNIISPLGKLTLKGQVCSNLNFEDNLLLIEFLFSEKIHNIQFEKFFSLIGIFFSQNIFFKTKSYPRLLFYFKFIELIFKKLQKPVFCDFLNIAVKKYLGKINTTMPNLLYELYQNSNFSFIKKDIFPKEVFLKNFKKLNYLIVNLSRISGNLGNLNLSSKFDSCLLQVRKYSHATNGKL